MPHQSPSNLSRVTSSNLKRRLTKKSSNERNWETPFPTPISANDLRNWIQHLPTPFYLYDLSTLQRRIQEIKNFPLPKNNLFKSFTPRYAIKANPNLSLLKIFHQEGIAFDASSEFEVERILRAKIPAHKILLTAQQIPKNAEMFKHYFALGLEYNASSLHQLEWYGKLCPGNEVSLRINPGFGSGMDAKTNVGGDDSGFGIWHEYLPEINILLKKYNLKVKRLHTHVGSGSNPDTWERVTAASLELLKHFSDAYVLNIGGGFKVSRNPEDSSANLITIGKTIKNILEKYLKTSEKKLHFEIEPGTYYVAEAGLLIARVEDVISTGNLKKSKKSNNLTHFVKLNCGMNDLIRPTLYQSRHHIEIVPFKTPAGTKKSSHSKLPFIVIGHCCESGDLLSQPYSVPLANQNSTKPVNSSQKHKYAINNKENFKGNFIFNNPLPGDIAVIHGVGAYGSAMASRYNSFPLSGEYLFQGKDQPLLTIRKPETIEDVLKSEEIK